MQRSFLAIAGRGSGFSCLLVVTGLAPQAFADSADADADAAAAADADAAAAADVVSWHAGVELRPGYSVRPLRPGGGIGYKPFELHWVVDPLAFSDGVHDLDLTGAYEVLASGYSVMAGWRPTAIVLADGTEWQHSALIGGLARLPELSRWVRALFGLEFSMFVVRHGGGLPAEANCFCGSTVTEALGFSALIRIEYASAP